MRAMLGVIVLALLNSGCTLLEPIDGLKQQILAARPLYPPPEMDFNLRMREDGETYGETELDIKVFVPCSPDCYGYGDDADPEARNHSQAMFDAYLGRRPTPAVIKSFERMPVACAEAFMKEHGFQCKRWELEKGRGILSAGFKQYVAPTDGRGWRIERVNVDFYYGENAVAEIYVYVNKQTFWNAMAHDFTSFLPRWLDRSSVVVETND